MENLRQLLDIKDSKITWFLRLKLLEVKFFFEKAKDSGEFEREPGFDICDNVLKEFDELLEVTPPASTTKETCNEVIIPEKKLNSEDTEKSTSTSSIPSNFTPNDESKLRKLKDTFKSDSELQRYLGDFQLESQTYSDLWNEIQRKLLRLPRKIANSRKQQAKELAQEAGAEIDTQKPNLLQLPFKDDEVIYPGLKGSIQAKGLCLSTEALLDPKVLQVIKSEDLSEELDVLARLVSICITFINLEPDLHHALEIVNKFGATHLRSNSKECEKYTNILIQRFQYTLKAEKNPDNDPVSLLKAWIALDEAIHSLVFIPPADSDSWWGELKKRSRRILRKIEQKVRGLGHDVRIQELSGLYADIYKLSSKDYDLKLQVGGIPGEVQTCLRVYARIDQEELPGRVIFRSLQ